MEHNGLKINLEGGWFVIFWRYFFKSNTIDKNIMNTQANKIENTPPLFFQPFVQ